MTTSKTKNYTPQSKLEQKLFAAFDTLDGPQDFANFLRDLLTPAEITEFSHRLEIARLLVSGYPYLEIAKKVGTSTTTVTRVAAWLHKGCGGYQKVLATVPPRSSKKE